MLPRALRCIRFIYKLASDSQLPWVYGGEYPRFGALVRRVVEGWLQCGLNVHFVFDGALLDFFFLGSNVFSYRPLSVKIKHEFNGQTFRDFGTRHHDGTDNLRGFVCVYNTVHAA